MSLPDPTFANQALPTEVQQRLGPPALRAVEAAADASSKDEGMGYGKRGRCGHDISLRHFTALAKPPRVSRRRLGV